MSWKRFLLRSRYDGERREELQSYLEHECAENIARGMSREAAWRAANRKLGNATRIREEIYRMNTAVFFESGWQDICHGLRLLRRNPSFTAIALVTLALGIGASTAVFSLVNTILLRPLPFPQPEKIVALERLPPAQLAGFDNYPWDRLSYWGLSEETATFAQTAAFKADSFNLTGAGEPQRLNGLRASFGFFATLGIAPELGRSYNSEEDQPGRGHTVVISHQLWRDRFSSDPNLLGKAITLNGEPYTVVGIMPAGFAFPRPGEMPAIFSIPADIEIWVPLALSHGPLVRGEESELAVIARLRDGVSTTAAQAAMALFKTRSEAAFPAAKGWYNVHIAGLQAEEVGSTRRPLLLILAAVILVLLVAASNIANLLLARSLARQREFTVRNALGASLSRLARQLTSEGLVLAVFGGSAGLAVAFAAVKLVKLLGPADLPRLGEASLDWRVFLFAAFASIITGLAFSLAPFWAALRQNSGHALQTSGNRVKGSVGSWLRPALLVAQIALALVLVVSAGLLARTFVHMLKADAGFNPEQVLSFELTLPPLRYQDQAHIVQTYEKILDKLRAIPGVQSAGVVEHLPMGGTPESTVVRIPGRPLDRRHIPYANYTMTSPGYFASVQTPVLRGRDFQQSDTATSQPVAIINQTMARTFWPGEDAIGKQVTPPIIQQAPVIVGIVADTKHNSLREEPAPEMYVPYTQRVWPSLLTMDVVVRSAVGPQALTSSIRAAIREVDPDLPIANVTTLGTIVSASMVQQRFALLVLAAFAGLALLLATVGMYGVISYSVAQRTNEIGVRMALGAQRRNVLAMVANEAARLLLVGVAAGMMLAFGVARLISSFLYGVRPADPLTYASVTALLSVVVLLASYVPAYRATRVDPMIALHCE